MAVEISAQQRKSGSWSGAHKMAAISLAVKVKATVSLVISLSLHTPLPIQRTIDTIDTISFIGLFFFFSLSTRALIESPITYLGTLLFHRAPPTNLANKQRRHPKIDRAFHTHTPTLATDLLSLLSHHKATCTSLQSVCMISKIHELVTQTLPSFSFPCSQCS